MPTCTPNPEAECIASDFLIRRAIQSPAAPPFLGLIALDKPEQALDRAKRFLAGRPDSIDELFRRTPYLAAWSLAHSLAKSYGDDGDTGIYRHFEMALGIPLSTIGIRRNLHARFCTVCARLGMPTGGFDRMVDVYLLQAGVPVALLPQVIDAFHRQERAFGLPPLDNSAQLNRWEDDSVAFLHPSLVTPGRALLADETAYHAGLYARLRFGAAPANEFERKFAEILDRERTMRNRSGASATPRPHLVWRRGGVELLLPKAEGRFQLWPDDGRMLRLRGGDSWVLPQPWPGTMRWQVGEHAGVISFLPREQDIGVFDLASGRLVREFRADGGSAAIDANDVIFLCRSPFTVGAEPATSIEDGSFHAFAQLTTESVQVVVGGSEIAISARPRRRVSFKGGLVADGPQGPLHGPDASLTVETGLVRAEARCLRVKLGGVTADLECRTNDQGMAEIGLRDLLSAFPVETAIDPIRLKVELMAPTEAGTNKSSGVSTSAWVWPGFTGTDGWVYNAQRPPRNLMLGQARHLVIDSSGRPCLDHSGGYAFAQIVFDIEGEAVTFNLPWPDVTVTRRDMDGGNRFLPLGTRLLLSTDDRFDSLVIRSPDPRASLSVRGRWETAPFVDGLSRTLALRELDAPGAESRIVLRRSNGQEVVLLEVASALEPRHFSVVRVAGHLRVTLEMARPVDAVRLELENEIGTASIAEAGLAARPVGSRRPEWLSAEIDPANAGRTLLEIDIGPFADALTLARILVRPMGQEQWQPLKARRGDTYALILGDGSRSVPEHLPMPRKRFDSLSRWLADCYALPCWTQMEVPLRSRWQGLGRLLWRQPGGREALLRAAVIPAPEDAAPTWVPIAHPIEFAPDLFGAPPSAFASLAGGEEPGGAELATLAAMNTERLRDIPDLPAQFFLSFRNVAEADRTGEPLVGFDPAKYLADLPHPHIDSDPSAGWYWRGRPILGPGHWRAAHIRLGERLEAAGLFDEAAADEGPNSRRKEDLHRLITAAWQKASLRPPAPKREQADEEPHQVDVWSAAFLCDFARASRFGRVQSYLDDLGRRLDWTPGRVLASAGLMLRLAPELLGFYLLLWQIAKEKP